VLSTLLFYIGDLILALLQGLPDLAIIAWTERRSKDWPNGPPRTTAAATSPPPLRAPRSLLSSPGTTRPPGLSRGRTRRAHRPRAPRI